MSYNGSRSASSRTEWLKYCTTAPKCCSDSSSKPCQCDLSLNLTVDVSCHPIVNVDVDVSFQPIINVDVSCHPIVNVDVDVSFQPIINVDVSCHPIVNVDISFQPIINVDVSCNPIVNVDISFQPIINVDVSCHPIVNVDVSCITIVPSPLAVSYDPNSGITDAFSRLRVSNPYTLFEFNSILGYNPQLIDELSGGTSAEIGHSPNSYVNMSVQTSGDFAIRQSHEYILYQPGKSKLIILTGVLSTAAGVVSRIGTFDDNMGFFIESSGGLISVVKRTGSSSYEDISQAGWSDPLNGTGPSGAIVDFAKAQIFLFDMEWLGVGQVRCGIVQEGAIHYYYTFTHKNELMYPYIPMAKLPVRYEIRSTGGTDSMRMICGTVISEGGFTPIGKQFSYGLYTKGQLFEIESNNTFYPILALRLRSDPQFLRVTMKIKDINIFSPTNTVVGSWKLLLNPDISGGGAWHDVDTPNESAVQYMDISYSVTSGTNPKRNPTTTVTGGFILYSDYFATRTNSQVVSTTDELVAAYPITTGLSGNSDVVVLVINNPTGNSADILANIKWIEFM